MTILDADGRPVRTRDLLEEQARPSVGGVLSPWRESVADALTPARLARVMRDADRGEVEAYLTLAEEMEEREPHYASVLATRKLGVSGAPVIVEASDDGAHAKAIAEDVEALTRRPEFEGLVLDLMDALAKGFACVEILWARDASRWEPTGYAFRSQRHFVFDRDTLTTPRLRAQQNPADGLALAPFKWLVHSPKLRSGVPIRTGLARTVGVTYAAKRYTVSDWLAFLDIYGIPIRIGRYPTHMAEKKKALLAAVRSIGADAAAVIPQEMTVDIIESKAGGAGTTLFQQSAEYWDKQTSKVVLGQTMTSDDGSSLAQSKTHERVRFDIRAADARAVAATINRDLVRAFVDLNYGPQPAYPQVKIRSEEPEDTKALVETVRVFVNLGGKVQMSEIRDRLGFSEPDDGAELLLPESMVTARAAPSAPDTPRPEQRPELNSVRSPFAANAGVEDVVDELAAEPLGDWRTLLDTNVGRLLERVQTASSFEEARALLEELATDEGDVLDVGALVVSLARSTFQVRGVGDATDRTVL